MWMKTYIPMKGEQKEAEGNSETGSLVKRH